MSLDLFSGKDYRLVKLSRILPITKRPESDLGYIGVQNPWSVIDDRKIKVHELMLFLVTYYCRRKCVILYPTCVKENHLFRDILDLIEYLGFRYVSADIKPYGDLVHDVLSGIPLRNESVDLIAYDPPYLPTSKTDERGKDYDVENGRTVYDVKKFYSLNVFKEFHRVLRDQGVLIVKGSDFYYPTNSTYLYLFLLDIIDRSFYSLFRPIALYIYRFFYHDNVFYRFRIKDRVRPIITHTYFLVLKKK